MKNLSNHTDYPCELLASLLIKGVYLGEISKLGCLTDLVKQALRADTLYFL
jgi:hypothetical protein